MAQYRFTGWYRGKDDEPLTHLAFEADGDEQAWGHELPDRFMCMKLERFDGEGWDELTISEEEFFGALKEIVTGMTERAKAEGRS